MSEKRWAIECRLVAFPNCLCLLERLYIVYNYISEFIISAEGTKSKLIIVSAGCLIAWRLVRYGEGKAWSQVVARESAEHWHHGGIILTFLGLFSYD